eukprot:gnl/TRDRNA2_/TRDRNA2_53806_c0_seq1.p1 gnl/TRDRNA2_/TRDRNA2_53806_c0~~gnl/TRDRNA2_/TRDRNA2_53806_c0_seq1.p1  ORF type:complete len:372 (+),score=57.49 gnl/TRDRNA2_/TRDRNA2_53806_c0_seq1:179-1294(+)
MRSFSKVLVSACVALVWAEEPIINIMHRWGGHLPLADMDDTVLAMGFNSMHPNPMNRHPNQRPQKNNPSNSNTPQQPNAPSSAKGGVSNTGGAFPAERIPAQPLAVQANVPPQPVRVGGLRGYFGPGVRAAVVPGLGMAVMTQFGVHSLTSLLNPAKKNAAAAEAAAAPATEAAAAPAATVDAPEAAAAPEPAPEETLEPGVVEAVKQVAAPEPAPEIQEVRMKLRDQYRRLPNNFLNFRLSDVPATYYAAAAGVAATALYGYLPSGKSSAVDSADSEMESLNNFRLRAVRRTTRRGTKLSEWGPEASPKPVIEEEQKIQPPSEEESQKWKELEELEELQESLAELSPIRKPSPPRHVFATIDVNRGLPHR